MAQLDGADSTTQSQWPSPGLLPVGFSAMVRACELSVNGIKSLPHPFGAGGKPVSAQSLSNEGS